MTPQLCLEQIADASMRTGDEYGGPLPILCPEEFADLGKQLVMEFWAILPDRTLITTSRPLSYGNTRARQVLRTSAVASCRAARW